MNLSLIPKKMIEEIVHRKNKAPDKDLAVYYLVSFLIHYS